MIAEVTPVTNRSRFVTLTPEEAKVISAEGYKQILQVRPILSLGADSGAAAGGILSAVPCSFAERIA